MVVGQPSTTNHWSNHFEGEDYNDIIPKLIPLVVIQKYILETIQITCKKSQSAACTYFVLRTTTTLHDKTKYGHSEIVYYSRIIPES